VCHQEPAGEALAQQMVAVAGRGLDHLGVVRLRVAQQQPPEGGACFERLSQFRTSYPQGRAGRLDHGLGGRAVSTEDDGQADQTLPADEAHLHEAAFLQRGQHRDDAAFEEIGGPDPLVRRVENLFELQPRGLKSWCQQGKIIGR
jgi:hypothetical protein